MKIIQLLGMFLAIMVLGPIAFVGWLLVIAGSLAMWPLFAVGSVYLSQREVKRCKRPS